jgi:hypothetical protein
MSKFETSILHSRTGESFHQLNAAAKREQLSQLNLSLTTYGADAENMTKAFQEMQKLGFTPVKLQALLQGMAWLMRRENITLPSGKKQKQERGKLTGELLGRMDFQQGETNNLQVNVELQEGGARDILSESLAFGELLADDVKHLAGDTMILGRVLQKIKDLAKERPLLAFEENIPGQIPVNGPRLLLHSEASATHPDMRRKADHIITSQKPEEIRFGVLREVVRQTQVDVRRKDLTQALEGREIITVPKFKLDNWPTDALMSSTRAQVAAVVDEYIRSQGILCDPQDLKYQALFRLTTLDVSDAYTDGQKLEDYLQEQGAYRNWRNILTLD